MLTIYAKQGHPLHLGQRGENLARRVVFDLSQWQELYGDGTVQLVVQRPREDTPYPAAVTVDGGSAVWELTDADTAIVGVTGKAELQYYVGKTLAKSTVWETRVSAALGEPSEAPPEAQQGWVDKVLTAGADAENAAQRAEEAAVRQPVPNSDTGTWWVWDAESGAYVDSEASYKGDAVLYTPQELTEEQKAQARENIGAAGYAPDVSETLSVVKAASYPNITTFEYAEGDGGQYGYCVVKQGTVKGGLLSVDFDTAAVDSFCLNLYLFDASGNPHSQSNWQDSDDSTAAGNGGFAGELYEPYYMSPGEGSGYGTVLAPFTTQIPDGCTFIASIRWVPGTNGAGASVTTSAEFAEWATSGGVTFTVTQKNTAHQFVNMGAENANRYVVIGANGDAIPGEKIVVPASINPNIKSVNHRGYGTAPENTLSAYRLSKAMGFDMVECDVSLTSDGVAVLLHDATIDRTSDGTGSITEMTFEEVRAYDFGSWKSADYAGERIPAFEEFIALCRNLGLHPYIELKSSGAYTQEQISELVATVKRYGMLGKVSWISFNYNFLTYVRNAHAGARLGFVVDAVTESVVTNALALQNEINEVFVDAYYSSLTDDTVTLCVDAGLPLEVWGLDSADAVIAASDYITGFTTDTVVAGAELYGYYR